MNEKTIPTSRRRFEVHVVVCEVVDNPEYYEPLSERSFSYHDYTSLRTLSVPNYKAPKTIRKEIGQAAATFDIALLETFRSMRDGAFEAMIENRIKASAFACIVDGSFGVVQQFAKWFKRNPS